LEVGSWKLLGERLSKHDLKTAFNYGFYLISTSKQ